MKSLILAALIGSVAVGGAALTRQPAPAPAPVAAARLVNPPDPRQPSGLSVTLTASGAESCLTPGTYGPYAMNRGEGDSWQLLIDLPSRLGMTRFALGAGHWPFGIGGAQCWVWSFETVPAGGSCGSGGYHGLAPDGASFTVRNGYGCTGVCRGAVDITFGR